MSRRTPIPATLELRRAAKIHRHVGQTSATSNLLSTLAFGPISRDDNALLAALVADRAASHQEGAR